MIKDKKKLEKQEQAEDVQRENAAALKAEKYALERDRAEELNRVRVN